MKKTAYWSVSTPLLLLLPKCYNNQSETVLYAFSDSFAASWQLSLYEDKTFYFYLVAAENSGTYQLMGYTILLTYSIDQSPHWPKKMIIDTTHKVVESIDLKNKVSIQLQYYQTQATSQP